MNWLDWAIVAAVIILIIVVIRFIQKVTAVLITIFIIVVVAAFILYFLSQWDMTPQVITDIIHHSALGSFLNNVGHWIFNTLLGFGKEYVD